MLIKNDVKQIKQNQNEPILKWTSTVSNCVEICYALDLMGCINEGKASVKQITTAFGKTFNIDVVDYAQSMKFIKKRKRDNLFLSEMANTLFQFILNSSK